MKYQRPLIRPLKSGFSVSGSCANGPRFDSFPSCAIGIDASGGGGCVSGPCAEDGCEAGALANSQCVAGESVLEDPMPGRG